jgi:arginyl-tRNA--protein-N-Asp/Glu arginylyltransferase
MSSLRYNTVSMNDQALSLYITTEHPCGYFDNRNAANLIPDPQISMNAGLYSLLVSKGFRRRGLEVGLVEQGEQGAGGTCETF